MRDSVPQVAEVVVVHVPEVVVVVYELDRAESRMVVVYEVGVGPSDYRMD